MDSKPAGMTPLGVTNYTVQRTDRRPYSWGSASTKIEVYELIARLPVDCPYVVMSPTGLPVDEWS